MEIGALPSSLDRLLSATRAAQGRMKAPAATEPKSPSVSGLLSAYVSEKAPAISGLSTTVLSEQSHLGNFFDRII